MYPKSIIIKSGQKDFSNALIYKLSEIKSIRFFHFKINGFYTIVIKCHNYYNSRSVLIERKLYGSYIFLYSIISIILTELFINYYEHQLIKRLLRAYTNNFNKTAHNAWNVKQNYQISASKLSMISSLLLDKNSPFEFSYLLYQVRKNVLLDSVLKNFRNKNYIFADNFIDFSSKEYTEILNEIVQSSIEILNDKKLYNYIMSFVFKT